MRASRLGELALSDFTRAVKRAFAREGSDKTIGRGPTRSGHSYQDMYARQFMRLYGRHLDGFTVRVAEVGVRRGANLRAMRRIMPFAEVYGIDTVRYGGNVAGATLVTGDGYSADTWKDMPVDFDLIIDDGSHKLSDILRGIPVFTSHLRTGGVLAIEDIPRYGDVQYIRSRLPNSEVVDTRDTGVEDDLVVLFRNPPSTGSGGNAVAAAR